MKRCFEGTFKGYFLRLKIQKGGALGYVFSGFTSHETPIFVVFLYCNTQKHYVSPGFVEHNFDIWPLLVFRKKGSKRGF